MAGLCDRVMPGLNVMEERHGRLSTAKPDPSKGAADEREFQAGTKQAVIANRRGIKPESVKKSIYRQRNSPDQAYVDSGRRRRGGQRPAVHRRPGFRVTCSQSLPNTASTAMNANLDLSKETTLTLAAAAMQLPRLRRGRPVHPATLLRWVLDGSPAAPKAIASASKPFASAAVGPRRPKQ